MVIAIFTVGYTVQEIFRKTYFPRWRHTQFPKIEIAGVNFHNKKVSTRFLDYLAVPVGVS